MIYYRFIQIIYVELEALNPSLNSVLLHFNQ